VRARENWIAFLTIYRRELYRVLRIWPQTLLPSAITMTLYFVIFGDIIGSRIGTMDGLPYIDFIVPGLVMMAIINSAYLNVSSSFFGNKFQRNIEEMLVSPMPNYIILSGYVSGGVMRGFIVGCVVIAVSLLFTSLKIYSLFATITIAILTAVLFSLAGFINGIFAKKFDDVSIVPLFILTPLTYLGGVFYSVELLPGFWQGVTHFNPIFYMVNGFRYGLSGAGDIDIRFALWVLFFATLGFYAVALFLLHRGTGVKS